LSPLQKGGKHLAVEGNGDGTRTLAGVVRDRIADEPGLTFSEVRQRCDFALSAQQLRRISEGDVESLTEPRLRALERGLGLPEGNLNEFSVGNARSSSMLAQKKSAKESREIVQLSSQSIFDRLIPLTTPEEVGKEVKLLRDEQGLTVMDVIGRGATESGSVAKVEGGDRRLRERAYIGVLKGLGMNDQHLQMWMEQVYYGKFKNIEGMKTQLAAFRMVRGFSVQQVMELTGLGRRVLEVAEGSKEGKPLSLENLKKIADALSITGSEWDRLVENWNTGQKRLEREAFALVRKAGQCRFTQLMS
jgi:transcriptional regulator with XRE-family HTH domain